MFWGISDSQLTILKTVHGKWTVTHRLDKDTPRETHSNYPFNFISVNSDTTKSEEKGKKKKIEQTKIEEPREILIEPISRTRQRYWCTLALSMNSIVEGKTFTKILDRCRLH